MPTRRAPAENLVVNWGIRKIPRLARSLRIAASADARISVLTS